MSACSVFSDSFPERVPELSSRNPSQTPLFRRVGLQPRVLILWGRRRSRWACDCDQGERITSAPLFGYPGEHDVPTDRH
jgi:hypothetical protein